MRTLLVFTAMTALGADGYLRAPENVRRILDAPLPPVASVSPGRGHLLLLDREPSPSIAELARPMLRLAGHRINPRNDGPHTETSYRGATLVDLGSLARKAMAIPPGGKLTLPEWNPAGDRFAAGVIFEDRIEMWVGDVAAGVLRRVDGVRVNAAALGSNSKWFVWDGSGGVYVRAVPAGRGAAPPPPQTPVGPNVQESTGKAADTWTFQDLLGSAHDESLFDHYATAQLVRVEAAGEKWTAVGKPGILQDIRPAPGGAHLLVTRVRRPYSWLYPASAFPLEVEVWDAKTGAAKTVASLPLADAVSMDGVRTGMRPVGWKPDEAAALILVEAMDGGNPKELVPHRDRLVVVRAPFTEPTQLGLVENRFTTARFLRGGRVLVTESNRETRWVRTMMAGESAKVIEDRSSRDRYKNPGDPVTETLLNAQTVVMEHEGVVYYRGDGASPNGDRPFLDSLDLATMRRTRLFTSDAGAYEHVVAVLSRDGRRLLTQRESATEPPNYFVLDGGRRTKVSDYRDPAPELRGVTKRLITYKRNDGVPLSMTLYLPPGHKEGTRLPAVLYAYPLEFNDAATAGQVTTTANRFTTPNGASHLYLLLAGFAILDGASLPVVGNLKTANDTYIDQIVAGAKAAIDAAAATGAVDPARVGATGHSYGGFMTANLLAHSDLFKAGVARSGAYNRTLTPFGFQGERRTFWQAQDIYLKMSPFVHAQKINEPVLLIHGMADNNPGTFPVQSERLYQAIRGNGGRAKLVMLPHESHGYAARESIEHVIAETTAWFEKYLK